MTTPIDDMASRAVAAAALAAVLAGGGADAQTRIEMDNRNLKVDPAETVDPAYGRTLQQRSRQGRDRAERTGGSHIDTLHGPFAPPGQPNGASPEQAKPRGAAPAATAGEPAKAEESPAGREPEPRPGRGYERLDEFRGGALHELIAELLKLWNRPPETVRLRMRERREDAPAPTAGSAGPTAAPEPALPLPRIAAGQGLYARMLYAVNSDHPGPVLLEILEPPLAGAVATGSFERVREALVIRLDSLAWRGRRDAVEAWAVGLDCACFGVEGEIDRHWWERLILPAAVRFAEGFLTARGTPRRRVRVSGETVVEESGGTADRQAVYTGLGRAAASAGDILLQDAPTGPTVRIPRNAELAVVFERPPGGRATVVGATQPSPRRPPVARVPGTAQNSAGRR